MKAEIRKYRENLSNEDLSLYDAVGFAALHGYAEAEESGARMLVDLLPISNQDLRSPVVKKALDHSIWVGRRINENCQDARFKYPLK
jgi:hypothetical protein